MTILSIAPLGFALSCLALTGCTTKSAHFHEAKWPDFEQKSNHFLNKTIVKLKLQPLFLERRALKLTILRIIDSSSWGDMVVTVEIDTTHPKQATISFNSSDNRSDKRNEKMTKNQLRLISRCLIKINALISKDIAKKNLNMVAIDDNTVVIETMINGKYKYFVRAGKDLKKEPNLKNCLMSIYDIQDQLR